jgi:hypothetical protein
MDCFAALAMTLAVDITPHSRGADRARGVAAILSLEKQRAQGRPGARCTRGLVCKLHKEKRTRAYRFSGGIRPSLRNGFTAYSALSPATNSSCHRRLRVNDLAHPGRARKISADLTSATDARTSRLRRTRLRRSSTRRPIAHGKPALRLPLRADAAASTASHRAFRDDRDPPLFSGETGRAGSADLPDGLSEMFFVGGLDRILLICPSGGLDHMAPCPTSSFRGDAKHRARNPYSRSWLWIL